MIAKCKNKTRAAKWSDKICLNPKRIFKNMQDRISELTAQNKSIKGAFLAPMHFMKIKE